MPLTDRGAPGPKATLGSFHIIYESRYVSICGEPITPGGQNYCSEAIVDPTWDHDWCHACVKGRPWTDEANRIWRQKGLMG